MIPLLTRLTPILLAAGLLAACATTSGGGGGKASVRGVAPEVRAVERWDLLIARKAEVAYDYLTPGKRATETREAYAEAMNNRPIRWQKVSLYSKKCEREDSCVVALQVDVAVPSGGVGGMAPALGFVEETWIRSEDGVWYFLPGIAGTEPTAR